MSNASTVTLDSKPQSLSSTRSSDAETRIHRSACPLDCPDACSLEVTTEAGRLVGIRGDRRNALTDGFICSKVRRFDRHFYSPERLEHPMRRKGAKGGDEWERLSWDRALDQIAEKLREIRDLHGGEAILPLSYGGSNGYLSQDTTDARLFRRLGASRLARTVCAAPSSRAASELYGKFPGIAPRDYLHSRLILVWGANPSASGIHWVPILKQAQAKGAKLVVIDPRVTPLAKQADLHLGLRPGTDLPVALALIRWLFENDRADLDFLDRHTTGADELRRRARPWTPERAAEVSGLDVADLETVARLYAETHPAAIRCGWGPERNRNGGSAIAAILALPAVGGKFGRRGGGYTMSNSKAFRLDSAAVDGEPEAATREVNMNRLGEVLQHGEPPVQGLFVYNANPLMTLPDQMAVRRGLARDDLFTVVFDQVFTDTARWADVVLPATTFLEHRELGQGYGAMILQESLPVLEPYGEARSNFRVFSDLVKRLGLDRPGDLDDEAGYVSALLAQDRRAQEIRQQLDTDGTARAEHGETPIQFLDHFPATADGKAHLAPAALDDEAPEELYAFRPDPSTSEFPLALLSPATNRTINSTFGQLLKGRAELELDPADAEPRALQTGDRVRIWNELGEVTCQVRVSKDLRPGVAVLPKGIWARSTENGNTANALAPATYTDLGQGACFNDARVEVEKISSSSTP